MHKLFVHFLPEEKIDVSVVKFSLKTLSYLRIVLMFAELKLVIQIER